MYIYIYIYNPSELYLVKYIFVVAHFFPFPVIRDLSLFDQEL